VALNVAASGPVESGGWLAKSRTVAKPGFNRWLVPPAALAIHLCIGMAYGFSVFWVPLGRTVAAAAGAAKPLACPGDAATFSGKLAITGHALFATDCDWTQFDLGWMFTLFFVLLGSSAAIWGGWLEREGPRKAGVVSALCWCGGLVISAFGVYVHQLWLMWLGSGFIGGIGLGLGYISPVSTLVKWFPDRRGMATGMAIMGFGGGAMIGSPLASWLMSQFKTQTTVGVWQTFLVLAAGYFVFMMGGAFGYRVPPEGWRPEGWAPTKSRSAMIAHGNVALENAHKTPQFWLIWIVLLMNVSAGIGVIGAAAPMLQETFGGALFGDRSIGFAQFTDDHRKLAAAVAAGFVGLFSLFNIAGRFFWASISDYIGRKATYFIFFGLGILCYGSLTTLANSSALGLFGAVVCVIASMYGGGFATVPAYLADMFGTQYVGAIHGRLLTAWSTAGIVGPVLVNYLHDSRVADKVPRDHIYDAIFYWLVGLLVIGLIANAFIRPVADKWFIKDDTSGLRSTAATATASQSYGIGYGGLDLKAALAWAAVGIPIVWGVYMTLLGAAKIFQ
jgi:MFS family permease